MPPQSAQGQVGTTWSMLEQLKDVPVHGREVGLVDFGRFLSTQTVL